MRLTEGKMENGELETVVVIVSTMIWYMFSR